MKKINFTHLLFVIFLALFLTNCSGVNSNINADKEKLSAWNDSDSEAISDSVVSSILNSDIVSKFKGKRKPRFVVGEIQNKSGIKIEDDLLSKNIERAMLNSGLTTFIVSKEKRETSRSDRKSSNDFNSKKELKKYIKHLGTDFFLCGDFILDVDSSKTPIQKKYLLSVNIFNSKNINHETKLSKTIVK